MHGDFSWYELISPDPDAAQAFYGPMLGWSFADSGQTEQDYRIFSSGEGQVGGLMKTPPDTPGGWLGYVEVDDLAAMLASIRDGGGSVIFGPHPVPGVGPIALIADPQGAMVYVIEDKSEEESHVFSYDKPRVGHCAWNELMTPDPAAALHFYGQRFGWVKDGDMDMGPLGKYEFLCHAAREGPAMVGAVMPIMPGTSKPDWHHYFRVADIDAAVAHIGAHGGSIFQGPDEIPGGDFALSGVDPQGVHFNLVGARVAA